MLRFLLYLLTNIIRLAPSEILFAQVWHWSKDKVFWERVQLYWDNLKWTFDDNSSTLGGDFQRLQNALDLFNNKMHSIGKYVTKISTDKLALWFIISLNVSTLRLGPLQVILHFKLSKNLNNIQTLAYDHLWIATRVYNDCHFVVPL